eukprot:TRINITY_DN2964_c2_g1_i1.p1 TRINITY_DN2964_c2_g1~~TRINITY_DN2964_c2_g1_i1.p1  ORF type:complete len:667 (+),score=206.62 TRINITY_DN2964_c2_g1_i1:205-2001(+)
MKLSPAEVARTIAEVNADCVVFAPVMQEGAGGTLLGTNARFLVDHSGEIYLELDDGEDFWNNNDLDSVDQNSSILIGFDKLDDVSFSKLVDAVDEGEDDEDEVVVEFDDVFPDGEFSSPEQYLQMLSEHFEGRLNDIMGAVTPETFGALGAWGGLETLMWIHPWEFAVELVEAVNARPEIDLDVPKQRLVVVGVIRPITDDEQMRVRTLWAGRFGGDSSDDEDAEDEDSDSDDEGDREVEGLFSGTKATVKSEQKSKVEEGEADEGGEEKGEGVISDVEEEEKLVIKKKKRKNSGRDRDSDPELSIMDEIWPRLSNYEDKDVGILERLFQKSVEMGPDGPEGLFEGASIEGAAAGKKEGEVSGNEKDRNDDGKVFQVQKGDEVVVVPPFLPAVGGLAAVTYGAKKDRGDEEDEDESDDEDDDEDEDDDDEEGAVLYKVEILSIKVDNSLGVQEEVEVEKWRAARPDMLARAAGGIVERANGLDRARLCMGDLCLRERNLSVDVVKMLGIDHLGVDLRVQTGTEMQTLRFPFLYPATSERAAEKLLDELLRPLQAKSWRNTHKKTKMKQQLQGLQQLQQQQGGPAPKRLPRGSRHNNRS